MAIDTKDQRALHQARQAQLHKSSLYTEDFIRRLNLAEDYERASCPTCNHTASQTLFSRNNGLYCHCPLCDHIYLSNPLKEERLIDFYSGYPTSSLEWHQSESDFYRKTYQQGLDTIKSNCLKGRILDIGCSGGYFLSIASQQGFKACGIEPNKQEAAYAISHGMEIAGSTIFDLDQEEKFDVITLWDVLEHIREPVRYLNLLRSHLSPKGFVYVQVPSSDSLAARVMRGSCNMFDGIEHLTLFSARSLDIAFNKAGFSVVTKQSIISELHAVRNYLSYEPDPYLARPEHLFSAEFLTADSVESSGLGYKIQALYRIG